MTAAMYDPIQTMSEQQASARRRSARHTAWAVAAVALAVYLAFILAGVLGR
jgi:hypothetical protein